MPILIYKIMCTKSLGMQGRALKNALVEQILEVEARGGKEELWPLLTGQRVRQAWQSGDVESAAFYVGQSIGLVHQVCSCQELLDGMMRDAEQVLRSSLEKFSR